MLTMHRATQAIAFTVASLIAAAPALADDAATATAAGAAGPITATLEPSATVVAAPADAPHRSPTVAFLLSAGGSAVATGLFVGGIAADNWSVVLSGIGAGVVLPSAGKWYAGRIVPAGLVARSVGLGLMFVGAASGVGGVCTPSGDGTTESGCGDNDGGGALLALGLVAWVGGSAYDIFSAADDARHFNAKHAAHTTIAPTALHTSAGIAPGLAVVGSF